MNSTQRQDRTELGVSHMRAIDDFVVSKKSNSPFHMSDCPRAQAIALHDRQYVGLANAVEAGRRPCRVCLPPVICDIVCTRCGYRRDSVHGSTAINEWVCKCGCRHESTTCPWCSSPVVRENWRWKR